MMHLSSTDILEQGLEQLGIKTSAAALMDYLFLLVLVIFQCPGQR